MRVKPKKTFFMLWLLGGLTSAFLVLSLVVRHGGKTIYFSGFFTSLAKTSIDPGSPLNTVIFFAIMAFCAVSSYFLGSVNFAILLSREKYGDDIRRHGSKNAGMTNMIRVYGKKDGIYTILGDALKTSAAVLMARFFAGEFGAYLAGLFAVLGHIAPVWYKFKGGKGVVSSAIAILALDPIYFAVVLAVFLMVFYFSHYVSMGSVAGAFVYPAVVYYGFIIRSGGNPGSVPPPAMIFAAFIGVMVIFMHRSNIRRVYYGEEQKFYLFDKSKKKGGKP